jgi:hypothetical protein
MPTAARRDGGVMPGCRRAAAGHAAAELRDKPFRFEALPVS